MTQCHTGCAGMGAVQARHHRLLSSGLLRGVRDCRSALRRRRLCRTGRQPVRGRRALEQRTAEFGPRALVCDGDANHDLLPLMRAHLEDWAPVLAVFDPEGTELDFATVEAVSEWRQGKTKAELLVLLATHTGFLRMLWEDLPEWASEHMDRLYGTPLCRPAARSRVRARSRSRDPHGRPGRAARLLPAVREPTSGRQRDNGALLR